MRQLPVRSATITLLVLSGICGDTYAQSTPPAPRFAVRVELGGGTMITPELRNIARYDATVQGGIRFGVNLWGPIAVQAGVSSWYFPSATGDASVTSVAGGLRVEPRVGNLGRVFIDAEAGAGITGARPHAMIDASIGFEFALRDWIGLGPFARYARVFALSGDMPADADFWSAGLSASLRFPVTETPRARPAPPPPPDLDRDGVPDRLDQCVRQPEGHDPDPDREGCPDGDIDRDGVLDHQDWCRIEESGRYPDPSYPGCPLPDDDFDGVPNNVDTCRARPAGDHPDPAWPGCPVADADGDGVEDDRDACESVPRGADPDPDRPGCPDPDSDHDGIRDHADDCRDRPMGLHSDLSRRGCPESDNDRDSVPDAQDHCPTRAGAPSSVLARNGCPGTVIVRGARLEPARAIDFEAHGARMTAAAERSLVAIASLLRSMPGLTRIAIEVSSEDESDPSRNTALSSLRSEAVRYWFISHGIDARRVVARAVQPPSAAPSPGPSRRPPTQALVEFRIEEPALP